MAAGASADDTDKARRFRDAALPHLDEVYTLARYLLRSPSDAEDAVQECYLRALRHYDGLRGATIRPWLMAILRNVVHAEFARRAGAPADAPEDTGDDAEPLWQEAEPSPEVRLLRERDADTIRRLVLALPVPFREAIVLREINDLSYAEIADVLGAPVGTVMSRLARARALLRAAWLESQGEEPTR